MTTTALGRLLGESPLGCGCIPALRLMSLFHTISRFPINPSGEPVSPRPEGSCTGGSAGTRGASAPWRCQGPGGPWGNGLGWLNPRRARLGRSQSRTQPERCARTRAPPRAAHNLGPAEAPAWGSWGFWLRNPSVAEPCLLRPRNLVFAENVWLCLRRGGGAHGGRALKFQAPQPRPQRLPRDSTFAITVKYP